MSTDVLPVLRPDSDALRILDDLESPLEERLLGPMRRAEVEPAQPVLTKMPAPLDFRHTDRDTTLTAARYDLDPWVLEDRGWLRAPPSERKKLEVLRQVGIDPDLVFILRETPGRWEPGQTPVRMTHVETVETARDRHLQHLQVGAAAFAVGRAMLYTAAGAVVLVTGATLALGAITIAAAGAIATAPLAAGLDPIVLGGVVHEPTGAVAWVPMAAWDEIPR
jgi:hypothetical protein